MTLNLRIYPESPALLPWCFLLNKSLFLESASHILLLGETKLMQTGMHKECFSLNQIQSLGFRPRASSIDNPLLSIFWIVGFKIRKHMESFISNPLFYRWGGWESERWRTCFLGVKRSSFCSPNGTVHTKPQHVHCFESIFMSFLIEYHAMKIIYRNKGKRQTCR